MVKIYLRAILKDGVDSLALFDSKRNGAINELKTVVKEGDTILWKLDRCSGIKSITRIYSNLHIHPVFKSEPRKQLLCKGFKLQIEKGIVGDSKYVEEKYIIKCTLCDNDNTLLSIDPYIRVEPV